MNRPTATTRIQGLQLIRAATLARFSGDAWALALPAALPPEGQEAFSDRDLARLGELAGILGVSIPADQPARPARQAYDLELVHVLRPAAPRVLPPG